MAGQADRFGRPIPADPGYREIINNDGSTVQQRTTLYLGADIIATDDPDSDATRLNVSLPNPGFPVQVVTSVTGVLRSMGNLPTDGTIYQTREYGVYGTGLGGWSYRWDAASTATDDGVLVIKADFLDTGRFLAVKPADGIMNALACGPAAADLGSRTKSFDPTGVVAMGSELYRVSYLLRNSGWAGLEMPNEGSGYWTGAATIKLAPSAAPNKPFYWGSKTGALIFGNTGAHVGSYGINIWALGQGDSLVTGDGTLTECDHAGNPSFTQTLTGGDKVLTGVSNVLGLAAGDTIIVYCGADITDLSGWCYRHFYAEIDSIEITASPIGNVTIKQPVPTSMPSVPGSRGPQNEHSLRKIIGFQDGTAVSGFKMSNAFVTGQFTRRQTLDLHWLTGTFQHNHFGCFAARYPRWTSDTITGYDAGGGFTWYGGGCVLQACHGSQFDLIQCDNLDGVFLVTTELGSSGTRIDECYVTWNAGMSQYNVCILFGSTQGSLDIIDVGSLVTRGGNNACQVGISVRIGVWDLGIDPAAAFANVGNVDRILWKQQGYREMVRQQLIIPIPTSGSEFWNLPIKGLVRNMNMRVTYPTTFATLAAIGVTTLAVGEGEHASEYDIKSGFITARDIWFPINPASVIGAGGVPNAYGYANPARVHIGSNGVDTVPGGFLHIDVGMMLPELESPGMAHATDNSPPLIRGSDGAPTTDADYITQVCIDSTSSPRKVYMAIDVGNGASDWVALN